MGKTKKTVHHNTTQHEETHGGEEATMRKQKNTSVETEVNGVELVPISGATKRHMLRPRAGFEKVAKLLAAAVRANPALIAMDGLDLDQLDSDLGGSDAIDLACAHTAEQLALLEGTRFTRKSRSWVQTLIMYDRIRSTGRTNETVAFLVQTVEAFMKPKRKAGATADPGAPASPTVAASPTTPSSTTA